LIYITVDLLHPLSPAAAGAFPVYNTVAVKARHISRMISSTPINQTNDTVLFCYMAGDEGGNVA